MSSSWEQQRIGTAHDAGLMELTGHVIVMGAAEDRVAQDTGLMEFSGHAIVMGAAEDWGSTRCWSNGAIRTCHRHGSSRGSA